MLKNKKTEKIHTGVAPGFVGAVCILLATFDLVSPEKLTPEAVGALTVVFSALGIWWSNWRTPKKS